MDTSTTELTIHSFTAARGDVVGSRAITAPQVLAVVGALRMAIPGLEVAFSADRDEVTWILAGVVPPIDVPAIGALLSAAQLADSRPELPPRYLHRRGPEAVGHAMEHFLRAGPADERQRAIRRSRSLGEAATSIGPLLDRLLRVTSTLLRWVSANTTLDVGDDGEPDVIRARHAAAGTVQRLVAHEAHTFDRWMRVDAGVALRLAVLAEADTALSGEGAGPTSSFATRRDRRIHQLIVNTQMDSTEEGSP